MKTKLRGREQLFIASMLFGLFFGAGNLIFPLLLGAQAGSRLPAALCGMLVTAVGIPLLGILSMGVSRSEGLMDMASRVSRSYGYFFTCALYLTIGPLFAIPRCAATAFTIGIAPMAEGRKALIQAGFTTIFFVIVLMFSLRPSRIMDSVGKLLNPIFLLFLSIVTVAALCNPIQRIQSVPPSGAYLESGFLPGFLKGYDTLDALASLAFGIIVIDSIRRLGVQQPTAIARNTVRCGLFSMSLMAVIYGAIAVMGAQSYGLYASQVNLPDFTGGDAFAIIARHYFSTAGGLLLALTVTFCCLKTAVGLITSCAETFAKLFPRLMGYRAWAICFCAFSLLVSNIGLARIIAFSTPVLYFLYPLSIVLILLALCGRFFQHDPTVYRWCIGLTMIPALFDLIRVSGLSALDGAVAAIEPVLPLSSLGLGWILPALLGLGIGLLRHKHG